MDTLISLLLVAKVKINSNLKSLFFFANCFEINGTIGMFVYWGVTEW